MSVTSRSPIKARKTRKALRYHLKAIPSRYSRSPRNFSMLKTISFTGAEIKSSRSVHHGG